MKKGKHSLRQSAGELNEIRRAGRIACFFTCILLAQALLASGAAQTTGVLRGLVEDASGAPVPGATVKLIQKATREEFKTTADETGHFEFMNQPGDEYILSVRALGFEAAEVPVKAGAWAAPIRVRLEVAEVKEEVTVSAKLLSSPSAEMNTDAIELDQHLLQGLPVKDGDPLAIPSLFVDPAVAGTGGPKIIVDGVETNALELPVASIKRVYVNKNPYSAEFGRPGKGRIEVTTKRGTHHRYRGNLSTLLRNSALDARNAFATVRPLQQRAVSEAELDGPIGQKLIFFLAGRYDLNNQSSVVNAQTPQGSLVRNFAGPERNTSLFGRIDFRINPAHKVTATYKFKNKSRRNQGVGGFNLPERATNIFDHENELKFFETATPSANFINELRLSLKQERQSTDSVTDRPAIIVLGAFSAGGVQISLHQREAAANIQDVASLARGKHTLRFGGGIKPRFLQAVDSSNFGGTFTFSGLTAFSENRPFLFSINAGNPKVSYTQHEFSAFLQDEIRLRTDLSALLGLRYESQWNVNYHKNFAPRLALAYSPGGGQTVLRTGFGIFYERQPEIMEQQSLLYNGGRIQQIVISNPGFPTPFAAGTPLAPATPSVVRIAPDIRFPYLLQGSFAIERKLGGGQNYLTIEYMTVRGVRLYRMRNINAPLPGTTIRPNPNFININQFEPSGTSRGNSLSFTLQTHFRRKLDVLSQYTLSRTTDDTGGLFSLPADNYNLRPERGRADFDRRHRLNFVATYRLPRDFRLGGIVNVSSGIPFNITTGFDNNHDTVANDRPPGVTRNTGRGPGFANVDARFSKVFRFEKDKSRPQMELAVDAFNLFNQVNFKNFVGTLTSPFFGRANAAYPARQLQLSLRFTF